MNAIEAHLGFAPTGWDIWSIECDGVHYGDLMVSGNEIHIAIDEQHRRRSWSRRIARKVFSELLAVKKFVTTRTLIDEPAECFVKRLGFVQTNEDSLFRYWWLDSLPWEKTCDTTKSI